MPIWAPRHPHGRNQSLFSPSMSKINAPFPRLRADVAWAVHQVFGGQIPETTTVEDLKRVIRVLRDAPSSITTRRQPMYDSVAIGASSRDIPTISDDLRKRFVIMNPHIDEDEACENVPVAGGIFTMDF